MCHIHLLLSLNLCHPHFNSPAPISPEKSLCPSPSDPEGPDPVLLPPPLDRTAPAPSLISGSPSSNIPLEPRMVELLRLPYKTWVTTWDALRLVTRVVELPSSLGPRVVDLQLPDASHES